MVGVDDCGKATLLTDALGPGFSNGVVVVVELYPGISALRMSGPPLDHGGQRGGLLLTPRGGSSSVTRGRRDVVARVRDPIGASSSAKGADGG